MHPQDPFLSQFLQATISDCTSIQTESLPLPVHLLMFKGGGGGTLDKVIKAD